MRGGRGKGRTLKSVRPAQFSEGKKKKEKEIKEKGEKKKSPQSSIFESGLQILTECKYLLAGLPGGF